MAKISYHFNAKTLINQEKTTQTAVNEIKNWLPTVKLPELCDEFITLILLTCDNVIEDTKNRIQAHLKQKKEAPEFFENRNIDSEELQKCLTVVAAAEISSRTEDNNVILIFRLKDTSYSKFNLASAFKLGFMVIETCQLSNPPDGAIVCLDMKGVGLMHLTRLKLTILQQIIEFIQAAISVKLLNIYFLNANYIFDKLFKLIKVFMSEELVKIIKPIPVGTCMEEFCKNHVPARYLPKEYGGDLPNLDQFAEKTTEDLIKEKQYFIDEEKWRTSTY